jgi:hypothetical protein
VLLLSLWGCSSKPYFVSKPEPWRADEERSCLRSGHVRETSFIQSRSALGGPEACGALRPFVMNAALDGRVRLEPSATVRCEMIPAIERWVADVVQPAAHATFRMPVTELKVVSSYSCRPRNGISGGKLSEHGHANAIDVAAFRLADGRWVTVKDGWSSWGDGTFLQQVHSGSCTIFTTVLGPNADRFHRDHFHLDLARHGRFGDGRVCK